MRVTHGRYGGSIRWQLVDGPSVITAAPFIDLHRLLVAVGHHAPRARIAA